MSKLLEWATRLAPLQFDQENQLRQKLKRVTVGTVYLHLSDQNSLSIIIICAYGYVCVHSTQTSLVLHHSFASTSTEVRVFQLSITTGRCCNFNEYMMVT